MYIIVYCIVLYYFIHELRPHDSMLRARVFLAPYWLSEPPLSGGAGLRTFLLWLMGKKKRESFQDGGVALPVRWKTIEAAPKGQR